MSTPRPGAVLLITSAAAFLSSLDLFIVNIAFPDIRAAFPGTDLGRMSWILNGYTVVFAAFLALAGRLADRFGHTSRRIRDSPTAGSLGSDPRSPVATNPSRA